MGDRLQQFGEPVDASSVMAVPRTVARLVLATALIGCVLLLGLSASKASAATGPLASEEARFVSLVNAERANVGLPPLTVDPELAQIARDWATSMADANLLSHNPNLADLVTTEWSRLGENVGYGNDVDYVMALFLSSSHHYPNIVDPRYTHIGVGVVPDRVGRIWTAHEFMGVRTAASGAATAASAPAPTQAEADSRHGQANHGAAAPTDDRRDRRSSDDRPAGSDRARRLLPRRVSERWPA